jgi:hypothetical protein
MTEFQPATDYFSLMAAQTLLPTVPQACFHYREMPPEPSAAVARMT